MKTFFRVIVLCCLSFATSFGQSKIDSLRNVMKPLKQQGNREKVSAYMSHIAWYFLADKQFDSALHYYYGSLAQYSAEAERTASTFDGIGVIYSYKGFPDSSIHYYNKSLLLYEQLHDAVHINMIENNLSVLYSDLGLYEKALESSFDVLTRLDQEKPDRTLASCYNTIAAVYTRINEYTDALNYYNKALAVRKEIRYTVGIAQSYNNIGELYISKRNYDSALANLLRAETIKRGLSDRSALGVTLNNLGEVYLAMHNTKKAVAYFKEALQIKKAAGERFGEITALNNLGKLKIEEKDFKQAEVYLEAAAQVIHKAAALEQLAKNLTLKIKLYKAKHDYAKALQHSEELFVIKDSLLNQDKAKNLMAMGVLYETEKKEKQIDILERDKVLQQAEIENKQRWIQSLIITITLITIFGMLLLYSYMQIQKNKRKVENLLKELHHRVKNNLQILSSLLSLQSGQLTDQNAIQAVKSSEGRVNAMALIHRKLYADGQNRTINMRDYILELLDYLKQTYGYNEKDLTLNMDVELLMVDVDKAIPLGLVLNELISNAFKYAYTGLAHPQLDLSMKARLHNQVQILIQDNGKGFATQDSGKTSFGLKMVRTLITELRGKLEVQSDSGTKYSITLTL